MDLQLRSFKGSKRNDHGREERFEKRENEEDVDEDDEERFNCDCD